jgi:hypothetical protein
MSLLLAPDFNPKLEISKEISKSPDFLIKFHYVPFSAGKMCCFTIAVAEGPEKVHFSENDY